MKKLVNYLACAVNLALAFAWGCALGWGVRNDCDFSFLIVTGVTAWTCMENALLNIKVNKLERN